MVDSEGIMSSEICQIEKDKYGLISLIYGIYKNEKQTKNQVTDIEKILVVA